MGSHRAPYGGGAGDRVPTGLRPPGPAGARPAFARPPRRRAAPRSTLIILITCAALVIAAVLFFAAGAAARRQPAASGHRSVTTASRPAPAGSGRPGSGQGGGGRAGGGASGHPAGQVRPAAVAPGIGLRPGAVSPVRAGYAMAEAAIPKLTPLQLAGQRVIYSYRGLNPPRGLLWLIAHGEAAGVIFFSGNVGSPAHLAAVVRELERAAASPVRAPLLLMTDQEGGLVRRLPGPPLLSAKQIGESAHPWAAARAAGAGAGANLRGVGLNVNLAPVLDVYRTPGNFIDQYQRSFSSNPKKVAKLGQLYATAEQAKGVAATVKHFPGLGAAATWQNTDELPYRSAIAAKVKLVMVSWAIYPALDPARPAGLSSRVVQGELRRRLGFAGVTITDALEAGALGPFGSIARRARLAAAAGMDLILCAEQDYHEGSAAMHALEAAYLAGTAAQRAAFTAAAERAIALRHTLPG